MEYVPSTASPTDDWRLRKHIAMHRAPPGSTGRLIAAASVARTLCLAVPGSASAQTSPLCFDVPAITHCIEGRFRQFWEQNGGLPVFGFPLTPAGHVQT